MECRQCGKETSNPSFCSHSCSATHSNIRRAEKKPNLLCACGNQMDFRAVTCHACIARRKRDTALSKPISEFRVTKDGRYLYNDIRKWAKRLMAEWYAEKECHICGFDHTVHTCHIRPITSFPEDATMREVNSRENLIYLCPNHHAMLDDLDL